jgi:hypothetical protein
MKFPIRILAGAAIVVAALLAIPFLLPLGFLIPEIERIASDQLKSPVKVESLRLVILPLPHLTLTGIAVGKKPFLEVREVIITPSLGSVFDQPRVISEISMHGVVIGQALIAKASNWASRSSSTGPVPVRVERIEVRDAFVDLTGLKLRDVEADLDLTAQSQVARGEVRADKGHMVVSLLPAGKGFTVQITGYDWKLPVGPALLLSSLTAAGSLNPLQGISLQTIQAQAYGGTLAGKLKVGWAKDWTIAGNLDIKGVEIQPVVALFTQATTLSGRLSANPVVDMQAPSAPELAQALDIESDFKVENGILYNFDLSNAAKALLDKNALKGGQTNFDQFSGHLGVDAAGYYLTKVEIASGVLRADAEIFVSPKQELSGQVDVAIKGTGGLVSTPLVMSGTLQDPTLYPSKAALAGAAAGTALLGPGLGTTVGLKAARFTQKLFGSKPMKKKKTQNASAASVSGTKETMEKAPPPAHTGR